MIALSAEDNQLQHIEFSLNISPEEYLQYYRGEAQWVITQSLDGRKLQFPANLLQPHVTREGIRGRFILHYRSSGKAVKLSKMG